ncbi:MAG: hypothetical protein ACREMA_00230 [Longimicrobiales bacterium]
MTNDAAKRADHYTEATLAIAAAHSASEEQNWPAATAVALLAVAHAILTLRDQELLRVQTHVQGIL